MMTTHDDDLLARFAELPAHDLDPDSAERQRRRVLAVLARQRRLAERPAWGALVNAWDRAIEPVLVVGVCVVYLGWAVGRVLLLGQ